MSHGPNSSDSEQTTVAYQAPLSGSIFRKIHALLSYLSTHHSAKAKIIKEDEKPILRLIDDVVSALPTTSTGLYPHMNKASDHPSVNEAWKFHDREPILVVLSDVRPSSNVNSQVHAKCSLPENDSTLKTQPRELKVYSVESHPRRLCLDLAFEPNSKVVSQLALRANTSKTKKKKRHSTAGKRISASVKEKEQALTVRRCEDGSYTTTTLSATGLGHHTRWHYDS